VTFSGTWRTPTSWSATSIAVPVPSGATTGKRCRDSWQRGQQRRELHRDGSDAEHYEPESDVRSGGDVGDDHRCELWCKPGDEHGEVQWHGGDGRRVGARRALRFLFRAAQRPAMFVVTVGGVASNGVNFTVTVPAPSITSLNRHPVSRERPSPSAVPTLGRHKHEHGDL